MNPHDKHFASAFADLGERLNRGIATLEVMSYEPRRAAKLDGLEQALVAYYEIATSHPAPGVAAWREFTDRIFAAYTHALASSTPEVKGNAAGFALALDYQRGYGANVDAPGLDMLAPRPGPLS